MSRGPVTREFVTQREREVPIYMSSPRRLRPVIRHDMVVWQRDLQDPARDDYMLRVMLSTF